MLTIQGTVNNLLYNDNYTGTVNNLLYNVNYTGHSEQSAVQC